MKILTFSSRPCTRRQGVARGLVFASNHQSPVTNHRSRAFTMLEIMIAISIFALVLIGIYSSWTAILRARKVAGDAAASVQRARISIRILEDSLGSTESFVRNANY